jgi:CheY-like chemotaxis protein
MISKPTLDTTIDAQRLFEGFENLMPFRVRDILLVSSLYDSFILKEDGRLNELLIGESLELNLQQIPSITQVSTGSEALAMVRSQPRFNLVVTNLEVGDMDAARLAREIRAAGLDIPIVVLAYDYRELKNFVARNPHSEIERVFLWQGNVRVLIAIVKYVEDKRNATADTTAIGVPIILVVEDYPLLLVVLPVIYPELIAVAACHSRGHQRGPHSWMRAQRDPAGIRLGKPGSWSWNIAATAGVVSDISSRGTALAQEPLSARLIRDGSRPSNPFFNQPHTVRGRARRLSLCWRSPALMAICTAY